LSLVSEGHQYLRSADLSGTYSGRRGDQIDSSLCHGGNCLSGVDFRPGDCVAVLVQVDSLRNPLNRVRRRPRLLALLATLSPDRVRARRFGVLPCPSSSTVGRSRPAGQSPSTVLADITTARLVNPAGPSFYGVRRSSCECVDGTGGLRRQAQLRRGCRSSPAGCRQSFPRAVE
jgi:hypothetical protein